MIVLSNSLYLRCVPIEYDLIGGKDTWVIPELVLSNSLYGRCVSIEYDLMG